MAAPECCDGSLTAEAEAAQSSCGFCTSYEGGDDRAFIADRAPTLFYKCEDASGYELDCDDCNDSKCAVMGGSWGAGLTCVEARTLFSTPDYSQYCDLYSSMAAPECCDGSLTAEAEAAQSSCGFCTSYEGGDDRAFNANSVLYECEDASGYELDCDDCNDSKCAAMGGSWVAGMTCGDARTLLSTNPDYSQYCDLYSSMAAPMCCEGETLADTEPGRH
jgi:hypothetical protein